MNTADCFGWHELPWDIKIAILTFVIQDCETYHSLTDTLRDAALICYECYKIIKSREFWRRAMYQRTPPLFTVRVITAHHVIGYWMSYKVISVNQGYFLIDNSGVSVMTADYILALHEYLIAMDKNRCKIYENNLNVIAYDGSVPGLSDNRIDAAVTKLGITILSNNIVYYLRDNAFTPTPPVNVSFIKYVRMGWSGIYTIMSKFHRWENVIVGDYSKSIDVIPYSFVFNTRSEADILVISDSVSIDLFLLYFYNPLVGDVSMVLIVRELSMIEVSNISTCDYFIVCCGMIINRKGATVFASNAYTVKAVTRRADDYGYNVSMVH